MEHLFYVKELHMILCAVINNQFLQTEKVRAANVNDMSVLQAINIVLDKHPELR